MISAAAWLARLTLFCLLAGGAGGARAGSNCEDKPIDPTTFGKAMLMAAQARAALDDSGAQVALIARVGQDLSKYGLRYSHMAYAWRDHPRGRWLVVHELNECGSAESALYNEGLANFFLDDMFAFDCLILVPSAPMQARLAAMLASRAPLALHQKRYNMLAYPFATEYQNSNQWLLETYAVASAASADTARVRDRGAAQAWLARAGYRPITLAIPAMTRLGARLFRANIAFDDQPFARRMAGQIDTVTVESIVRFVQAREEGARSMTISLE
ncbi:MAG: DUF2145 domain-containing protein [Pseudomonadota bacterium]